MASSLCAMCGCFTEWMEIFSLTFGPWPDWKKKKKKRSRSKVDHSYKLDSNNNHLVCRRKEALHSCSLTLSLSLPITHTHTLGIFTASISHCVIKVFHQSSLLLVPSVSHAHLLPFTSSAFFFTFLWLFLPATVEYELSAAFGRIKREREQQTERGRERKRHWQCRDWSQTRKSFCPF